MIALGVAADVLGLTGAAYADADGRPDGHGAAVTT